MVIDDDDDDDGIDADEAYRLEVLLRGAVELPVAHGASSPRPRASAHVATALGATLLPTAQVLAPELLPQLLLPLPPRQHELARQLLLRPQPALAPKHVQPHRRLRVRVLEMARLLCAAVRSLIDATMTPNFDDSFANPMAQLPPRVLAAAAPCNPTPAVEATRRSGCQRLHRRPPVGVSTRPHYHRPYSLPLWRL